MKRPLVALALAACLVPWSSPAAAADNPYDLVRLGLWGGGYAGTELTGRGSVARVARPTADLELSVRRHLAPNVGFELRFLGFPVKDDTYSHVRGDTSLDVRILEWRGAAPGGLTGFVGAGFDVGRYAFAGRAYPRLGLRVRLFASPSRTVEVSAELLPASAGPEGRVVQHRSELAFGWSLFQAGFRVSHAFHTLGDPSRTFMIQEMSAFVGVGIMR